MSSPRALLVAASLLVLGGLVSGGCVHPGYHVGVMARLYRQGNCPGSLDRAMQIEDRVPEMPLEKQAHYAIFRGSCHLMLGQLDAAAHFLGQGAQMRAQFPMLVQGGEAAVLDQSLAQLAQAQGQMQVAPPPPAVIAVPAPPAVGVEVQPAPQEQQPPPPAVGVH